MEPFKHVNVKLYRSVQVLGALNQTLEPCMSYWEYSCGELG